MAMFAEGILKTHWDHAVPVNLARIARAMGVAVALDPQLASCALLEISAHNQPRVTIGARQSTVRQRYGVAHALGHVALHHLRPGMQRHSAVADDLRADHSQRWDSEANDFALCLLLPESALRQRVSAEGCADLGALAASFEVAPLLVKQRLADLDLQLPRRLTLQLAPELRWD